MVGEKLERKLSRAFFRVKPKNRKKRISIPILKLKRYILEITKLSIEKKCWGEHEGKYIAEVKIKDDKNELSIVLSPEVSEMLLPLVADELCKAASNYANDLREKLTGVKNET